MRGSWTWRPAEVRLKRRCGWNESWMLRQIQTRCQTRLHPAPQQRSEQSQQRHRWIQFLHTCASGWRRWRCYIKPTCDNKKTAVRHLSEPGRLTHFIGETMCVCLTVCVCQKLLWTDQQSNNWNIIWFLTSPRNKSLLSVLKKNKKKER